MPSSSHRILRVARPGALTARLSKELDISPLTAQLLVNRGISAADEAVSFLNPSLGDLSPPGSFGDMPKAVELVRKAARAREKVLVCGDYDVDGITALALIKEALAGLGLDALTHMPHRIKEGYGLSRQAVSLAKSEKVKLVITADCGTSNHREVEELRRNNISVVITDHHEPSAEALPGAEAIINPKAGKGEGGFRELAGVGVAHKFCQGFSGSPLYEYLDLVALGTIADVVPLRGENRILVKEGLKRLAATKRPGLNALMDRSGLKREKFSTTSVSFILGPRLNASGRMESAQASLDLLLSRDHAQAGALAEEIEQYNRARQKAESRIMDEAQALIDRDVNFKEHKIIVIAKENWHKGVLGIVASKLADRFYRPAIVISLEEELCKGSGRSIKNFHLFSALKDCKGLLHAFGGHAHAAGLVITRESIDDFRAEINRLAHERLSIEDLLPSVEVDMEIGLGELNEEVAGQIARLEPFGAGNPEPLFLTRNLTLRGRPQGLSRETLKFWATDGKHTFQAIGFGLKGMLDSLLNAQSFDLVYYPRLDTWLDETTLLLEVKDIVFR
jgi:single-stranded-DNA-specific exonuclease